MVELDFNRLARGLSASTRQVRATAQGDASRELSRSIEESNKQRQLTRFDSILQNDQIGIYKVEELPNGAKKKTLRADWQKQFDQLQDLYSEEFGDMIGYDSLADYISKDPNSDEPVKKKNRKVYGAIRREGVPSSVEAEAEAGSESAIAAAKEPQDIYVIPVQNQEGRFSLKTIFGTDQEDDKPLKFSAKELEMYLSVILPEMMEIRRNPSASTFQSNLQSGSFDIGATGQDGVSFTEFRGGSQDSVVGLLNKDTVQEVAAAFMDPEVSTPEKISLLAALTKEYNQSPVILREVTGQDDTVPSTILPQGAAGAGAMNVAAAAAGAAATNVSTDPITLSLTDVIPELQGITTDEEVRKVIESIGTEELASRGISAESVANIQTIMSEQGINDSEELKKAVEDKRINNPYVVSASLGLILQDENGLINGQPYNEWTDEYFNYITSGVKNQDSTAMDLTNAMLDRETQQIAREKLLIDDAANKNAAFANVLKQSEIEFKRFTNRVGNVTALSENAMKYLSNPTDNANLRSEYVQFTGEFNSLVRSVATKGRNTYREEGGPSDYELVENYWNSTDLGKAGVKMTDLDYFRITSNEVEGVSGLMKMRYEIAADNVIEYLTGNVVPNFGIFAESDWQDWLDDFANVDFEKGKSVLTQESLVVVRNANGIPYKIAGKNREGTIIAEAELSRFIEDLTSGNKIRLEDLSLLLAIIPTVGDQQFVREQPGPKQRRDT